MANVLKDGTDDLIRQLHAKGLYDYQIARELDISKSAVYHHRRNMGLAGNGHNPKKLHEYAPEIHEQRMNLYKMGFSDEQIGRQTYYTPQCICNWRKRYGLAPNPIQGWRKKRGRVLPVKEAAV